MNKTKQHWGVTFFTSHKFVKKKKNSRSIFLNRDGVPRVVRTFIILKESKGNSEKHQKSSGCGFGWQFLGTQFAISGQLTGAGRTAKCDDCAEVRWQCHCGYVGWFWGGGCSYSFPFAPQTKSKGTTHPQCLCTASCLMFVSTRWSVFHKHRVARNRKHLFYRYVGRPRAISLNMANCCKVNTCIFALEMQVKKKALPCLATSLHLNV